MVTYQDAGQADQAAAPDDILWGQVTTPGGLRVMACDVQAARSWHPGENAVYVVVGGSTANEITAPWQNLGAGVTILQDLAPSQWSPLYGMLKDQFGITWVFSLANAA